MRLTESGARVLTILIIYGVFMMIVNAVRKMSSASSGSFVRQQKDNRPELKQKEYTYNTPNRINKGNDRRGEGDNSFGMGKERATFNFDKKKIRHKHGLGSWECKEIDCGLDEKVFGPKNQHKDIF